METARRTLTTLTGLALCTTLAGGLLAGCNLDTNDTTLRPGQDSTGSGNPPTTSLMAPSAPELGHDREDAGAP